jgi:hypothetical protein
MVEMLQPRTTEQSFPFRTLGDARFPLRFGSDAPGYYLVDPLRDLDMAVSHQALSGQKVNAGEVLTMPEALRNQTINTAYMGVREQTLGSIEAGKLGDIAVLGDHPFTFLPERFWELPIDIRIASGNVMHRRRPHHSQRPQLTRKALVAPSICECIDCRAGMCTLPVAPIALAYRWRATTRSRAKAYGQDSMQKSPLKVTIYAIPHSTVRNSG